MKSNKVKIGLLLTLCLIGCLVLQYFSAYAFDCIVLFLSLIATSEFFKMELKSGYPGYKYCPEIVCTGMFAVAIIGFICSLNAVIILLILLGLIAFAYLLLFAVPRVAFKKKLEKDDFRQIANMNNTQFAFFKANNSMASIFYPALFLFFIYFINHIQNIGFGTLTANTEGTPLGLFGIILLFAICCLTDTFAMAFGCLIKGKKLCPKISPNKTISGACFGLLGGMIGSVLTYVVFSLIFPTTFAIVSFWHFLLIGLIGSVVAQVGDLFESFSKRRANLKDSGDFFRSHGGVLDRLDSVIFNAPVIFVCLLFLFG